MSFSSLSLFLTAAIAQYVAALDSQALKEVPIPGSSSAASAWHVNSEDVRLFEYAIVAVVIVFIITFVHGGRKNLFLARSIALTLSRALSQQFAEIGTEPGKLLTRDGQSFYWFYASGRRHTSGLTVAIDLFRRMDIFAHTSSFMSTPDRDRIIYYLPISKDVQMDPLTLFIVKRKELTRLRGLDEGRLISAVEEVAADVVNISRIPYDLIVMSEHADIVSALLPESIRDIIARNAFFLLSIHVTEQGARWDSQSSMAERLIRVEFTLPFQQDRHDAVLADMARISLHLLDTIATVKISPVARKKAIELRKRVNAQREKQEQKARAEEAAARRLEKKKQEEEAVSKMSAEKQRKYEEKKRKREIAARMRKAVKK